MLSSKHHSTASWASLAFRRFDASGVWVVVWTVGGDLFLSQAVSLKETRAAGESVTMGSPLLAVAGLAVHVVVRAVAGDDRIEGLGAVAAFEALAMPFATLGQDLFRGVYHATATWATLTGCGLDDGGIDYRCPRGLVPVGVRVAL